MNIVGTLSQPPWLSGLGRTLDIPGPCFPHLFSGDSGMPYPQEVLRAWWDSDCRAEPESWQREQVLLHGGDGVGGHTGQSVVLASPGALPRSPPWLTGALVRGTELRLLLSRSSWRSAQSQTGPLTGCAQGPAWGEKGPLFRERYWIEQGLAGCFGVLEKSLYPGCLLCLS